MSRDFLDILEARLPAAVERGARSVDRRRISRAIDRALAPAPRRLPRARVWIGLAAAAVMLAAVAAASIVRIPPAAPLAPAVDLPPAATTAPIVQAPAFEPAVSVEDLPRSPPPPIEVVASTETAAELFTRANRARQSGDTNGAIALYQRLERQFPSSNEAAVAHVSLGRALLDDAHDANGALAEFDRYLATPGATDLREEALVGRARACSTLGRRDDERRAWQSLLAEHPDSLYVARAKERIEALR